MVGGGTLLRLDSSQIEVITPELVEALIKNHDNTREVTMYKFYKGEHGILNRKFSDESKPNNKIVINYCELISDNFVGYFMGKPVIYSSKNKDFMDALQDVYDSNDEQRVNIELAQETSRYGWAAEILYIKEVDGKKQPRFRPLNLSENKIVLVFDDSVEENLILAMRYFDSKNILTDTETTHAYIYTDSFIYHFKKDEDVFVPVSEEQQYFGEVPINFYWNVGRDLKSDYESIVTLNESYNSLASDDVNESEFSVDAILKVWGIDNLPEAQNMKEKRMINFGNVDKDTKTDAEWLTKDIDSEWKENQKNRTLEDIHRISKVPNMSDDGFAESSGIALERRILPFENQRSLKERFFKEGLQRRIRMITRILNISNKFDYREIDIRFQKNLPSDTYADATMITSLIGKRIVSNKTLRKLLPFVDDPAYEEELIRQEEEEYIRLNVGNEEEDDDLGLTT
jgi:SPP1 family phage portal protein